MATITSVGSGLWSNAAVWDAGVPVDGDDVIISAGHTVTFDVDQSAFVTGVSVVITGILTHTINTGSYCLFIKTGASISGAGVWNIGTKAIPIPFASKHLITGISGWYINGAAGLSFTCYAAEPTIKYVQLTGNEAIGQTVLSIDTDLTGITDYWKSGDSVLISELIGSDRQTYTISGISATELTISSGLSAAKDTGAVILLLTRNVIVDCLVPASQTFSNLLTFTSVSIGGGLFKGTSAKSKHCFEQVAKEITLEGGVFYYFKYVLSRKAKLDGVVFADNARPGHLATGVQNHDVIAVGFEVWYGWEGLVDGLFSCGTGSTSFDTWNVQMFNCKMYAATNLFSSSEHYLSNCETYGGVNFSWGGLGSIKYSYIGQTNGLSPIAKQSWVIDNTIFASENPVDRFPEYYWYIASTNHNQIQGNLNAWTKGGKTISQNTVLPVGYTDAYLTVLANASWEAYWETDVVISAGASVNIEMSLRKDASMSYLPRCLVFNKASVDPFAGGAGLYTFTMTDSINTWESDVFTYTNSGSSPVTLTIRFQGKNATGNMYSALDVEQINVDLTNAIALITDVKAKTDQLSFTVANQVDANALSGGTTPADVADAVWDEVIADHNVAGSFGAKNQKVVPSESVDDYKADVSNLALESTLAAIKGVGWSTETLKAIADAISALNDPTPQQVWEYTTRSLSTPSDYKADVSGLATTAHVQEVEDKVDNLDGDVADVFDDVGGIKAELDLVHAKTNNLPASPAPANEYDARMAAIQADLDNADQYKADVSAITGAALSAAGVDAILDEVVVGTYTMRQLLALFAAKLHGTAAGGNTDTITYDSLDGTTTSVIVETVDEDGNRTVVLTV